MFALTKIKSSGWGEYAGYSQIWLLDEKGDKSKLLCCLEEWMMNSCAVAGLHGFKYGWSQWFNEPKNVDALLKWLDTNDKEGYTRYPAKEYLVCLSAIQVDQMKGFVNHPNIRQIDQFSNKAHGGNPVHMYRLSSGKDFEWPKL